MIPPGRFNATKALVNLSEHVDERKLLYDYALVMPIEAQLQVVSSIFTQGWPPAAAVSYYMIARQHGLPDSYEQRLRFQFDDSIQQDAAILGYEQTVFLYIVVFHISGQDLPSSKAIEILQRNEAYLELSLHNRGSSRLQSIARFIEDGVESTLPVSKRCNVLFHGQCAMNEAAQCVLRYHSRAAHEDKRLADATLLGARVARDTFTLYSSAAYSAFPD